MSALLEVLLMVSGLSVLLTVHFTQMAFSSSFTGVVTADNANYSKYIFLWKIKQYFQRLVFLLTDLLADFAFQLLAEEHYPILYIDIFI